MHIKSGRGGLNAVCIFRERIYSTFHLSLNYSLFPLNVFRQSVKLTIK